MLGSCNELSALSSIFVNEVTTVGSVWPLAAFMTSPSHLGYAPGDASFLNAVSSVPELINIRRETLRANRRPRVTSPKTANSTVLPTFSLTVSTLPAARLAMVPHAGTCSGSQPQAEIFHRHGDCSHAHRAEPTQQCLNIFGLTKADTSYQPTLASAPPDWTLTLTYLVASYPFH